MSRPSSADAPFAVLFVCTGNICRSALAERLGRAYLDELLGADAGDIRLTSAGTRAVVGSAMHPDSALVLRGFGAEPGDFRARQFVEGHAAAVDLVLTMTRAHRQHVVTAAPRALSRTFTLLEAARLLEEVAEEPAHEGDDRADPARTLVRRLAAARARRQSGDDDIRDPIGQPVEVHEEVGAAIAEALLPLLGLIASRARPG